MGHVVLVTGVCREIGRRFARRIANEPGVDLVIGVDVVPPGPELGDVHFIRADIRNPMIAKVIAADDVDTVVHLGVIATPSGAGSRASMKEINVIGTMQLLAACQQSGGVERLVVKSSAKVYGASPKDPAMFTEDMAPKRLPRSGFAKDSVEVEGYVRGFARRRPDVGVTMLRCANIIGPMIDTTLTRYFELPVIPTPLGFDARLQFCHEEDALAALLHATTSEINGTFNVAGDGVMLLSQAIRRLGKPTLPVPPPLLATIGAFIPALKRTDLLAEQPHLTFGRGIDTTAMREILGFRPAFTTADAFESFASRVAQGPLRADRIAEFEQQLNALIAKTVPNG